MFLYVILISFMNVLSTKAHLYIVLHFYYTTPNALNFGIIFSI
jgi:hypothetical protein